MIYTYIDIHIHPCTHAIICMCKQMYIYSLTHIYRHINVSVHEYEYSHEKAICFYTFNYILFYPNNLMRYTHKNIYKYIRINK